MTLATLSVHNRHLARTPAATPLPERIAARHALQKSTPERQTTPAKLPLALPFHHNNSTTEHTIRQMGVLQQPETMVCLGRSKTMSEKTWLKPCYDPDWRNPTFNVVRRRFRAAWQLQRQPCLGAKTKRRAWVRSLWGLWRYIERWVFRLKRDPCAAAKRESME